MQAYHVKLESEVFNTFRCQRAANSLDIDTKKKSVHELTITGDFKSDFCVGLIVGSSGSGKTSLAKKIYGDDCFAVAIKPELPIIDQLPQQFTYDECADVLSGIGLTSVPCWIRPVYTLSNGQRARAEAAMAMLRTDKNIVIDEWTSVVDRTVAKVMSHCVQKFARKNKKHIVLLSCHYDVIEWLDPDWIVDCNEQKFIDRRLLPQPERERKEKLNFVVAEVNKDSWKAFSKYHYLSDALPSGAVYSYGLFHGENQIGFQCFANYVPIRKNTVPIFHFNRVVVHPDYAGLSLGVKFVNECCKMFINKMAPQPVRLMGKFSSIPMYKSLIKDPKWQLREVKRQIGQMIVGRKIVRKKGYRENIKTFSFEFVSSRDALLNTKTEAI